MPSLFLETSLNLNLAAENDRCMANAKNIHMHTYMNTTYTHCIEILVHIVNVFYMYVHAVCILSFHCLSNVLFNDNKIEFHLN